MDAYSNKILLIDDDKFVRKSIECLLEDMGYAVLPAEDGFQGLNLLKQHPDADLVLVDLIMPLMDGFSFIQKAREFSQEIPIVVISGVGILEQAVEAIRLGAWDFINKPITNKDLLEIIINRNIEKYMALKASKEYQAFLENLAKMRSNQLDEAIARQKSIVECSKIDVSIYTSVFRLLPIPTLLVQSRSLRIFDANDAFLKLTGRTSEHALGVTLDELGFVLPDCSQTVQTAAQLAELPESGAPIACKTPDGKTIQATLKTIPFNEDGIDHLLMMLFEARQENA